MKFDDFSYRVRNGLLYPSWQIVQQSSLHGNLNDYMLEQREADPYGENEINEVIILPTFPGIDDHRDYMSDMSQYFEHLSKIEEWLSFNCEEWHHYFYRKIWFFKSTKDAMLFKLVWG